MLIIASCHLDDYVCIAALLDLLGWSYDKAADKADSMPEEISALGVGVLFDLSATDQQKVFINNTEKRKADVCKQIADALQARTLSCCISPQGCLGLAEGQLFGRSTRRLLNELGMHALNPPRDNKLKESTLFKFALSTFVARMIHAKPRLVEANTGDVFFLFADASFDSEAKTGGLGGVLLDQSGTVRAWFGGAVDSNFRESFMAEEQEQAIGELEAFAALIALHLSSALLGSRHLVSFLDNEGSRFLILKGCSSNATLTKIAHEISLLEEERCILAWYARVPTEANVSDSPSPGPSVRHATRKFADTCGVFREDTQLCSRTGACQPFLKPRGEVAEG